MESQSMINPKTPLLNGAYAYGVVERPFPLNCFLKNWYDGPNIYHAVKIGTVNIYVLIFATGIYFGTQRFYLVFVEALFGSRCSK